MRALALIAFLPSIALAQAVVTDAPTTEAAIDAQYLAQPNLKTALARSEQKCVEMKCDGINTRYWWNVIEYPDGTAVIVLDPAGPYSTDGLSKDEKAALTGSAPAIK